MYSELSLEYMNALTLILPQNEIFNLYVIGCGGTGSWLAPAVARVGRLLAERFPRKVNISFYDPDRVEEKNIYRQNFCTAEIGRNKAETLALRYGLAWGIEINAVNDRFGENTSIRSQGLTVLIGCVDTTKARKGISAYIESRWGDIWWLDCGNTKNAGQVLLGCHNNLTNNCKDKKDPFTLPGYCSLLPLPSKQHPELVAEETTTEEEGHGLSCAEMALRDSQGLAINQRIAAEAADYLVRMLITHDLKRFATYIDLESGTARSKYITEDNVKAMFHERN